MSNVIGTVEATPKKVGFMSRPNAHEERIKKDEEELEELTKSNTKSEEDDDDTDDDVMNEEPKTAEDKTFKKRYGDLRRHSQKKEKEYEDRIAKLEAKLNDATKDTLKLPKSEEEVKEWMKKYPDVAGIVETIAIQKSREASEDLNRKYEEFAKEKAESYLARVEAQVAKAHPDYFDIKDDDAFYDWIETKSKKTQNIVFEDEPDADAISEVLDLFKAQTDYGKKKRKSSNKTGAEDVNPRNSRTQITDDDGAPKFRESHIMKMKDKEFEENWEEIQKAKREGRIIYDVSGGAR